MTHDHAPRDDGHEQPKDDGLDLEQLFGGALKVPLDLLATPDHFESIVTEFEQNEKGSMILYEHTKLLADGSKIFKAYSEDLRQGVEEASIEERVAFIAEQAFVFGFGLAARTVTSDNMVMPGSATNDIGQAYSEWKERDFGDRRRELAEFFDGKDAGSIADNLFLNAPGSLRNKMIHLLEIDVPSDGTYPPFTLDLEKSERLQWVFDEGITAALFLVRESYTDITVPDTIEGL